MDGIKYGKLQSANLFFYKRYRFVKKNPKQSDKIHNRQKWKQIFPDHKYPKHTLYCNQMECQVLQHQV